MSSEPPNKLEPWQWPEETWRKIVGRARAGRSLKPAAWPNGARCAVAISFDADHETIPLRDNDESPMRISQGQYGNRQATPRIRRLLERVSVPATFFYPAVSALLYDSSLMADDDPYELEDQGEPTGIVELPPEWIRDDAVYFNMLRFSGLRPYTPPSAVEEIFTAEFDGAWEERGMFLLTMHPHIIGHRSRLPLLDRLIGHMKAKGGCWFATHAQIAAWCKG